MSNRMNNSDSNNYVNQSIKVYILKIFNKFRNE